MTFNSQTIKQEARTDFEKMLILKYHWEGSDD